MHMDILASLSRQIDILHPETITKVLQAFREYLMPNQNSKIASRNQNLAHGSNAIIQVTNQVASELQVR